MKAISNSQKYIIAFLIGCILSTSFAFSQDSEGCRWSHEAGFLLNMSRLEGDGPSHMRQSANDLSTNWGTRATYSRKWAPGFGVYFNEDVRLLPFLGLRISTQLVRYSTRETFRVNYDPAIGNGILQRSTQIQNNYYAFSPGIGFRGNWKGFGLYVGGLMNVFAFGRTQTSYDTGLADGSSSSTGETVSLDTQDQPIFADASVIGGVANYTHIRLRNHGANPVWFAGVAQLSWKILDKKWAPVVGLSWQIPFSESQRSQNPRFSLIGGLSQDLRELELGYKIGTASLSVGWGF